MPGKPYPSGKCFLGCKHETSHFPIIFLARELASGNPASILARLVEMPVDEAYSGAAGDMIVAPVRRRKVRRTRSPPFGLTDQRVPRDSAHAAAAARRIAALEARIAYLESQVTDDELTGLLNRRGRRARTARG